MDSAMLNKVLNKEWRAAMITSLWVLVFLMLFDVGASVLFPYPQDPQVTSVGFVSNYLDYGRSLEGKLRRMVGKDDAASSAIAQAGWLSPEKWQDQPTQPEPGKNLLMALYGQSFTQYLGEAIVKLDPKISMRLLAGPAAPPNYAYAAYEIDRNQHKADVVILGLLASSVKAMRTLNGMTWQFEGPAPYTYPRYSLVNDRLVAVWPQERSLKQLRATLQDPTAWRVYLSQLRTHDGFYSPFLFEQNLLDNSAILRMVRRAVAQRHQKAVGDLVYNRRAGFNTEQEVPLLRAMVTNFAATAKQAGQLPIVLIFNDQGFSDHLFQALKPTLEAAEIPYVSTHSIVASEDLANFVGDGHFTDGANQKFAQAVLSIINKLVDRVK
jgi:hypothetical protein